MPPQCGQPTEVETEASKTNPQRHVYSARSDGGPASRRRRDDGFAERAGGISEPVGRFAERGGAFAERADGLGDSGGDTSGRAGAAFAADAAVAADVWRRSRRRRRSLPVPDLDLANMFMTANGSNPDWFRG